MRKVLVLLFSWFLIINIFATLASNRLNLLSDSAYSWINTQENPPQRGFDLTSSHVRWDSKWYIDIAKNGYSYDKEGLSNVVFFPLYPILMKAAEFFTGMNLSLSGWIISVLFAGLSVIYLYKLAKEFHKNSDPILTAFLMLLFPTAIFLNAVYSESTFLFFSIASFYHVRKGQLLKGGIFGLLAALTRFSGILLFVPLAIELIYENRKKLINEKIIKKMLQLLLIPLGSLIFFLFYWIRFGDFFMYFTAEDAWGRNFGLNQENFLKVGIPATVNFSLDAAFVFFGLITSYLVFKKVRPSYGIYMLLSILVPLASGTFASMGRYILVLFPIYLLGASIKDKVYNYLWILTSALFLGLYLTLYASGYWAG
jgi:Gpi18-like mannosyltransferase